jgi:uncharacterized membrane protein YfcA
VLEPWQWALAGLGAYLVGLSKTGIAGLGVLSVALFASALPARESTGIVLVVLIGADIVAVTAYRREVSWPHLLRLFPWAAAGVIIGFLIMGRIDSQTTQKLIGVILVSLVGLQFWRSRSKAVAHLAEGAQPHRLVSAVAGVSAGITTMIANAAGPIMIIYLLAMHLPKMIFMGTSAWFFFAVNLFKVPFSYSLGLINLDSLRISVPLIPFAVAGALTGRVLIKYIDQRLFELLAMGFTLLAGLRLLLF